MVTKKCHMKFLETNPKHHKLLIQKRHVQQLKVPILLEGKPPTQVEFFIHPKTHHIHHIHQGPPGDPRRVELMAKPWHQD